jgi:phospholipid transport system substrate-binding protein
MTSKRPFGISKWPFLAIVIKNSELVSFGVILLLMPMKALIADSVQTPPKVTLIYLLILLFAAPAWSAGDQPIEALQKGVDEGLRILKDPKFKDADLKDIQQQKLWAILQQLFDFQEFSRRVLASNWKNFTPGQKEEFVAVFGEFLAKFYLGKLQEKYKDESIIYMSQELRTRTRALVSIQVLWKGQKIPVELRMLRRKGAWKVYDIQVIGISALRNYRAQFQSILRKATPAQVIERLKQKIKQIEQKQHKG